MREMFSIIRCTFAAACLAYFAGTAFGQSSPESVDPAGAKVGVALSGDEIRDYLTDRTITGCYSNGQLFSEHTRSDGTVLEDDATVGVWEVRGRTACYKYEGEDDFNCMQVFSTNTGHFFFHPSAGIVSWDDKGKCDTLLNRKN